MDGDSPSIFQFKKKVPDDFDKGVKNIPYDNDSCDTDDTDSELGYQNFLKINKVVPTTSTEMPAKVSPNYDISENNSNINNFSETLQSKTIIDKLANIEEQNGQIIKNQRTIMRQLIVLRSNQLNASAGHNVEDDPPDLNLPTNSVTEFQDLEEKCKEDPKTEKLLQKIFNNMSLNDLSKFVNTCLQKIITDEAAQKFSWFGLQGNISIKKYLIIKILKGSAAQKFPNACEQDISNYIKKWFQRAKDRVRKQTKANRNKDA